MEIRELIAQSMQLERDRIAFLERTRGAEAAHTFARCTRSGYRRAVVRRSAPALETVFRLRLIGSYCYLKRYLASLPPESIEFSTDNRV